MAKVQFKPRPATDYIVVHCAATKASMDIGVREIRQWHVQQGWLDIGYHFVIRRNGTVENGRPHDVIGSHVKNYNSRALGICLAGGIDDSGKPQNNFTPEQFNSLMLLLKAQKRAYPQAQIVGHHDLDAGKACPSFKVSDWLPTVGL
ncbi:N-acetylmuramoyl-L-alanine amidase [Pseudomonas phage QAC]|jgi:N-acetyl-anhydromuramyl-L-alanine amidase AmpD|uniref:Endolysin n=3 Tax=Ghunavirus TaxID=2732683 RepID=A0AAE7VK86_9CAUD|nr:amidase [Pseudomonas phage 17A]QXV72567.1 N-acetylmuramoyl-L-alanine amidase [Pseudomonas phage FRS]UAV89844.1 N-acetylmuramoyl-L-alanine amidase [Pseudomonas phage QAC]